MIERAVLAPAEINATQTARPYGQRRKVEKLPSIHIFTFLLFAIFSWEFFPLAYELRSTLEFSFILVYALRPMGIWVSSAMLETSKTKTRTN